MEQENYPSFLQRRDQLQQQIKAFGAASLTDEQNLEFLLSYGIKSDPRPMAHALIRDFGSLKRVMESSIGALASVEGVTDQAAQFLYLISQAQRAVYDPQRTRKPLVLKTPRQWTDTLKRLYINEPLETVRVAYLNQNYTLLRVVVICRGEPMAVSPSNRLILESAMANPNNAYAILMHNHPHCDAIPSEPDLDYTSQIKYVFRSAGVTLLDHVIVGDQNTAYSLRLAGDLSWQIPDEEEKTSPR